MAYPQIVEYNEAVQHPTNAFIDPELRLGSVRVNGLGLPLVLSGGFVLTYTVTTPQRKWAVRCFHREIPEIQQKYAVISNKLKSLSGTYFVDFNFQKSGIIVGQHGFPIVRMDWVEGDPFDIWLDKNFDNAVVVQRARADFFALASFLEREGIAHGDISNGNVMMSNGSVKLIDYDGMFVPGLPQGRGSETGHKHFQHPDRGASDYGPGMDRFSFIALDLSLQAVIEEKALFKRFRDGGETIVFKANDFADPDNSEIFQLLLAKPKLKDQVRNFAAICVGDIKTIPTLEDFLSNRNIPAFKALITTFRPATAPRIFGYIAAFPVIDARDYAVALRRVGDRVELIGQIIEVKPGVGRRGKGRDRPYVFINFGSWRGSIVKISIWSEGLDKLAEKPSNAWIGRWVSVTGLMDPPYVSRRYGYTHLSITVQEDGQIQQLAETQAHFRLASIGKPMPQRNRDVVGAITGGSKRNSTPTAPLPSGKFSAGRSATANTITPNRAIVDRFKQGGAQPPPVKIQGTVVPTLSGTQPPSKRAGIPTWAWVVLGIIVLLFLLSRR